MCDGICLEQSATCLPCFTKTVPWSVFPGINSYSLLPLPLWSQCQYQWSLMIISRVIRGRDTLGMDLFFGADKDIRLRHRWEDHRILTSLTNGTNDAFQCVRVFIIHCLRMHMPRCVYNLPFLSTAHSVPNILKSFAVNEDLIFTAKSKSSFSILSSSSISVKLLLL